MTFSTVCIFKIDKFNTKQEWITLLVLKFQNENYPRQSNKITFCHNITNLTAERDRVLDLRTLVFLLLCSLCRLLSLLRSSRLAVFLRFLCGGEPLCLVGIRTVLVGDVVAGIHLSLYINTKWNNHYGIKHIQDHLAEHKYLLSQCQSE